MFLEPIEAIFELKAINNPTEIKQGEIINLTSNSISNHDNDKYTKYLKIKSKNPNSKKFTKTIQNEIIILENKYFQI
jgi:hypothetical protein